jgi:hypothetical protein
MNSGDPSSLSWSLSSAGHFGKTRIQHLQTPQISKYSILNVTDMKTFQEVLKDRGFKLGAIESDVPIGNATTAPDNSALIVSTARTGTILSCVWNYRPTLWNPDELEASRGDLVFIEFVRSEGWAIGHHLPPTAWDPKGLKSHSKSLKILWQLWKENGYLSACIVARCFSKMYRHCYV